MNANYGLAILPCSELRQTSTALCLGVRDTTKAPTRRFEHLKLRGKMALGKGFEPQFTSKHLSAGHQAICFVLPFFLQKTLAKHSSEKITIKQLASD
jgi:hypothetical protein